jgi:hypothetical protein
MYSTQASVQFTTLRHPFPILDVTYNFLHRYNDTTFVLSNYNLYNFCFSHTLQLFCTDTTIQCLSFQTTTYLLLLHSTLNDFTPFQILEHLNDRHFNVSAFVQLASSVFCFGYLSFSTSRSFPLDFAPLSKFSFPFGFFGFAPLSSFSFPFGFFGFAFSFDHQLFF